MAEDWREQGQEEYLRGLTFAKRKYKRYSEQWDHDHCEFCWSKFCEESSKEATRGGCFTDGYATLDSYRWICETCFHDFREKYRLKLGSPKLETK